MKKLIYILLFLIISCTSSVIYIKTDKDVNVHYNNGSEIDIDSLEILAPKVEVEKQKNTKKP